MKAADYKKIVIKLGTNVLSTEEGYPDYDRIRHISDQIAALKNEEREIIIISSGSVAFGRSDFTLRHQERDAVIRRQVLASIGQVKLINTYVKEFTKHNIQCAQVLVTKSDFRDRLHYLNMRNCLEAMLHNDVIPVVNENDAISVRELMFTDNDELAGLVASLIDADALIILSNVDGIYNGDPDHPDTDILHEIKDPPKNLRSMIATKQTRFGRGGMATKCSMALKTARLGINTHIANGKKDHILTELLHGNQRGSHFIAHRKPPDRKKWLAHTGTYSKGTVYINEGAKKAMLSNQATSLLPVGISRIEGDFKKGDIIQILDENGTFLGLGMVEYGSEKARENTGLQNKRQLVHYDYLYLNEEEPI